MRETFGRNLYPILGTVLSIGIGVGAQMILPSTPHNGVSIIALTIAVVAIIWALSLRRTRLKRGGSKMIFYLGIGFILVGCVFVATQLDFHAEAQLAVKTTVSCCILDNTYQIVANNQGTDTDTVVVTLGTSGTITDIQALMGASLPHIIEGGPNGNFITFKISELPPGVSLGYLIDVVSMFK